MKNDEITINNDTFSTISNIKSFIVNQNELGFFHPEIFIEYCVQNNQYGEVILTWRIDQNDMFVYNWDYRFMIKNFGPDIKRIIKNFLIQERDKIKNGVGT